MSIDAHYRLICQYNDLNRWLVAEFKLKKHISRYKAEIHTVDLYEADRKLYELKMGLSIADDAESYTIDKYRSLVASLRIDIERLHLDNMSTIGNSGQRLLNDTIMLELIEKAAQERREASKTLGKLLEIEE